MTKRGEAVGRREGVSRPPLMSDLAQNRGSSLTGVSGPRGRGWDYLIAGDRKDAQRKGDTAV